MAENHLSVRVTPKASRSRIEVAGQSVKVYVTSPPADGEANRQVIQVLAKALRVAPSRLAIIRGDASREKVIAIEGLSVQEALALLS